MSIRYDLPQQSITFTPTVFGSTIAGTITYTSQVGRVIRTGNLVFLSWSIVLASWTGSTGNLSVGNLPTLAPNAGANAMGAARLGLVTLDAGYSWAEWFLALGDNTIILREGGSNIADRSLSMANVGQTATLVGSLCYSVV
jgi:hypothetical protein